MSYEVYKPYFDTKLRVEERVEDARMLAMGIR